MAESTGNQRPQAIEQAGGWVWLILVFAIHLVDVFIRYRTGTVNFFTWTLFFVIYAIIALRFYRKWHDKYTIIACYILTAFLLPFLYPRVMPYLGGGVAAMIVAFAPTWVLYLLLAHSEYYPRLSFAYLAFWIILLTFTFMPQVQLYAQEQGYSTAYSPAVGIKYLGTTATKAYQAGKEAITGVKEAAVQETKRTYKAITGDYYTGEVDKSTEKPLGVFLDELKAAQATFVEGKPATVYTTMRAETMAEPLNIKLTCTADSIPANEIKPKSEFTIYTADAPSIDCKFLNLQPKSYNFKLTADFPFTTRSYQLVYTMDKEKLIEARIANKDPLADFSDKNPKTQHSSGPVMIGMGADIGLGKQPLGVSATDATGPTVGVTIDNIWSGKLKKIEYILLITPKGIEVTDVNGIPAAPVPECSLLPTPEDQERCDITTDNVYYVPQEEIDRVNQEKDIIAYTFRAYTKITDYSKLIGPDPLPKFFKVTARYDYGYSAQKTIQVEKSKTPAQPAETTTPSK